MTVYLELYHGRSPKDQQLNDWGTQGPVFGPYDQICTTYATHIRMLSNDGSKEDWLYFEDDLVYYDGVWYGDWAVFGYLRMLGGAENGRSRLKKYNEQKAAPPKNSKSLALYTHDCNRCEWLGTHKKYDIYTCKHSDVGKKTIIMRDGSEGHQYASWPAEAFFTVVEKIVSGRVSDYGSVIIGGKERLPENMWSYLVVTMKNHKECTHERPSHTTKVLMCASCVFQGRVQNCEVWHCSVDDKITVFFGERNAYLVVYTRTQIIEELGKRIKGGSKLRLSSMLWAVLETMFSPKNPSLSEMCREEGAGHGRV